jgi:uncharacterized membrane protein YkoI
MYIFGLRLSAMALAMLATAGLAHAELDVRHLKLVRAAPTGLRQAVATAERDLKGKAYAATSSFNGDVLLYSIKLLVGDKPVAATIDAKSGKITSKTAVAGENAALLKEFSKLKGSLLAAIRAAEGTAKGKSFGAVFKRLGNKALFDIDAAARDDAEKEVFIDAGTGKIRKVTDKSADPAAETAVGATAAPAQ